MSGRSLYLEETNLQNVPSNWTRINPDVRGLWVPGLVAIRNAITGKAYFFAASNLGKRVRDQHALLVAGRHHCRGLQADWTANQTGFDYFVVLRADCMPRVAAAKQAEINAARTNGGGCYNVKNSLPKRTRRRRGGRSEFPTLRGLLTNFTG